MMALAQCAVVVLNIAVSDITKDNSSNLLAS